MLHYLINNNLITDCIKLWNIFLVCLSNMNFKTFFFIKERLFTINNKLQGDKETDPQINGHHNYYTKSALGRFSENTNFLFNGGNWSVSLQPLTQQVMESELVNLTWKEFQNSTIRTFKNLQSDEHFSDVTLVCGGGKQLNVHKVILSSCSQLFKEILTQNPHNHPLIYLVLGTKV